MRRGNLDEFIKWLEQQVNSKDTKLAVAAWRVLEAWKKKQEAQDE